VPLLLVPLLILLALPILLPLSLVQRYRVGTARRLARGWVATLNIVLLSLSIVLYLIGAAMTALWLPHAMTYAVLGLALGGLLGVFGLLLSRWEPAAHGLEYTPNRWLVLALTLIVASRVIYGIWRGWHAWLYRADDTAWLAASGAAGSFAAGGLVLGYYAIYWIGVRRRLARHKRVRGFR
jgi:hypothetical protein